MPIGATEHYIFMEQMNDVLITKKNIRAMIERIFLSVLGAFCLWFFQCCHKNKNYGMTPQCKYEKKHLLWVSARLGGIVYGTFRTEGVTIK